ncbi:MAG: DUF885 family protein [Gammaproteobacteria bacterium]
MGSDFRLIRGLEGLSAGTEGRVFYAERFAAEDGWHQDDPVGRLGQLSSELFRARRLVVDTGLHAKGWTRQQAIDFGIEASEVERYVVMPGQPGMFLHDRPAQDNRASRARSGGSRRRLFIA